MSLRLPDRALLVNLFYQNDNSTVVALQKFRTLKRMRKGPLTVKNLRLMVTKFEETGSLNVRSGRGRKHVSAEAIEKVALQVEEVKASNVQASTSVRRVAEALDLLRSTVQKIMRNILHYYPYKLQLVQELLPHDFETQHLFSLQFLVRLKVDPEWLWMTKDPRDRPSTLSFERFGEYLQLPNSDLQARQCLSRIIFMQDGDLPHITRCVKDIFKYHFTEERVISRQFHYMWSPQSPDLNPCDFWLWGHLKQLWHNSPFRTRPTVTISLYVISSTGLHVKMYRSSGQSDVKSPVFSSQASLVLIYRPTEGMKGGVDLAQPRDLSSETGNGIANHYHSAPGLT
ncbi:uncharacterized protein TNCV_2835471 [Trichonephila clavipes]|uniref:DUF4817 domain-containing protein n=1 Tax=Trichonephila clavipes TaxID=2585209 RepID=A0A8X6RWP8_TRICX|nr:uncharacterized protein TNCV_2835471 [Trichonephila clavipes]